MNYEAFLEIVRVIREDLFRKTFDRYRNRIKVKKEETVIRNLEKIFCATLRIANRKGFQTMSMRDLSRESGLSMGALYTYFSSKEELLSMLQEQGRALVRQVLEERMREPGTSRERLERAIRSHLYISEAMQPWFYFSYMETKNLTESERGNAIRAELETEQLFADILAQGEREGVFQPRDHRLAAGALKALLQDWYLKRGKYARREVTVERYADFVVDLLERFYDVSAES
ncbi:MAG: TetR/AcrR family transcriptional regulator [Desulfococcaceae bacterium]